MAGIDDLRGRAALVTGAGSGIGRATALALAEAGAHVVAVDLDGAAAEKTAVECGERGAPGDPRVCDVADVASMKALAADVHGEHGPLDVVVANAGVGMTGRFLDMDVADWGWIRSINLDGVVHTAHAFGAPMVERGEGHVVLVSSGLGYTPRATEPAYVTTKAAVLALAQCLRADWRSRGVGVSAVCPGVINTPIIDNTRFLGDQARPDRRARAVKTFRRGHSPEKVASAIVDAVRTNKAVVPVGWEAKLGWYAHRVLPVRAQQIVARQEMK